MTLEEKNNKLFDLNSKIALYKNTIKSLQKEIDKINYGDDDCVGKCYVDLEGDFKPTHYIKILNVDTNMSTNESIMYNYMDVDINMPSIYIAKDYKKDIINTTYKEITNQKFKVMLLTAQNKLYNYIKQYIIEEAEQLNSIEI